MVKKQVEYRVWVEVQKQSVEDEKFTWTQIIYEKMVAISEQIAEERLQGAAHWL